MKCLAEIYALVLVVVDMKNTKKIALCGMIASLCVVIMLTSHFPYLTYAVPAISGLLMIVPVIECGITWGIATYITSSALIFFIGEAEAMLLYILFLGYYPILKSLIERINKLALEWVLKLVCFNVAAIAFHYLSTNLFGVPIEEFGLFGKYGLLMFLLLCNVVFIVYDIGVSRMASRYMFSLHDKVKKIMK